MHRPGDHRRVYFWDAEDAYYAAHTTAVFQGESGFVSVNGVSDVQSAWCDGTSNDIPEDFYLPELGRAYLEIPDGADRILLAPADCAVGDNRDPQNDYGVLLAY